MDIKLCEICHRQHDGKYGSGRFCNPKCAAKSRKINRRKTISKKKKLGAYKRQYKPTGSNLEKQIVELLKTAGINYEIQYQVGRYYFDIKIDNLLIEVNGDYWHANPEIYAADSIIVYPGHKKKSAKTVWKRDLKKRLEANNQGYKVLYLWESDIKTKSPELILKEIKQQYTQYI